MSRPNTVAIGDFLADNDGDDFRVTAKLTGWDDAPAVRTGVVSKAQQDGAWDGSGFFDARVITCQGAVAQASAGAARAISDALTALSPREVHQFTVDSTSAGARSALVRVTQGAVIEWIDDTAFLYSITLTAPDPLKYGPATFDQTTLAASAGGTGLTYPLTYPLDYGVPPGVVPGAIILANAGTAGYFPRLRIDGPVPNPVVSLAETGDWIRYGGTVAAGQWLDIDLANRHVLLNGQVSHRHLVTYSGGWLQVPAGGGSMLWTADAADPAATLRVWGYEGAWS